MSTSNDEPTWVEEERRVREVTFPNGKPPRCVVCGNLEPWCSCAKEEA